MSDANASAATTAIVIACLVRSEDFGRVLRSRTRARTPHFAVHHVAGRPSGYIKPAGKASAQPSSGQLSTSDQPLAPPTVDDSAAAPGALWLGAVVPKRHARRAVTRTLIRRQIRAVMSGHAAALDAGLWVVRLRAPFERGTFVSAASDALKRAARAELELLLRDAARATPAG